MEQLLLKICEDLRTETPGCVRGLARQPHSVTHGHQMRTGWFGGSANERSKRTAGVLAYYYFTFLMGFHHGANFELTFSDSFTRKYHSAPLKP